MGEGSDGRKKDITRWERAEKYRKTTSDIIEVLASWQARSQIFSCTSQLHKTNKFFIGLREFQVFLLSIVVTRDFGRQDYCSLCFCDAMTSQHLLLINALTLQQALRASYLSGRFYEHKVKKEESSECMDLHLKMKINLYLLWHKNAQVIMR